MAQQRNLDDPETAVEFAPDRERHKESRRLDAANAGRWAGHQRRRMVGLERMPRLAALSRDLAISFRSGSVLRTNENRTRTSAKACHRKTSGPITRRKWTRISSSCRTIISARSRSDEIVSHLRLFSAISWKTSICAMNRPWPPRSPGRHFRDQGHSIASFCAWDSQDLLAKIAGSFAVVPINILSADIYTRGDNVVLDVFRVCDTEISRGDRQARPCPRGNNPAQCAGRDRTSISRRSSIAPERKMVKRASRRRDGFSDSCDRRKQGASHLHPDSNSNPGSARIALRIALGLWRGTASRSRFRGSAPRKARRSIRFMWPIARPAEKSPIRLELPRCRNGCTAQRGERRSQSVPA